MFISTERGGGDKNFDLFCFQYYNSKILAFPNAQKNVNTSLALKHILYEMEDINIVGLLVSFHHK